MITIAELFANSVMAQGGSGSREKLEAAKIGIITEKLQLTTEQAERFWPIYSEFNLKRRTNHEAFKKARMNYNATEATDAETQALLNLGRETKANELTLEKQYSEKMLEVISNKQLLLLYEAEREFKERLLKQLEYRRKHGQHYPNRDQGQPSEN